MKYILVALVVLVGLWSWRRSREQARQDTPRPPTPPQKPADMVACSLCGVHLPSHEAIPGRQGVYCCEKHRQTQER